MPVLDEDPNTTTKTCSLCSGEKPLVAFSCSARGAHGRQSWCKSCYNGWRKDRTAAAKQVFASAPQV